MAAFDLIKRLMAGTGAAERRHEERLRAPLNARVLVVDDSATIRAVLGKMLLQDGYQVLKAADGEEALETARRERPDLIFLDIVLPGMSGFAVLRTLRRDAATQAIPIVMISGNLQATEQFYVQRFGADDFMKKPFGRAEVFERIRVLVKSGRLPQRIEDAPVPELPSGVDAEEWNAIPDVAMPDHGPHPEVDLAAIITPGDGTDVPRG
jgi:twitching motility two-component system response regulator PilH